MMRSLALALLLATATRTTGAEIVWPDPPEEARIRFVRTITPAAMIGKPSVLGRVWGFITGQRREHYMVQPHGLCIGPGARLYVADTFGRALHVYDLAKKNYSTISVDGDSLIGVAAIGERLFVTDSARVSLLCLDSKGRRQWSLGPAAGFLRPTGIAAAGDNLFVVDTLANRVVKVSSGGAVLASFGSNGRGPGQFNFPTDIAVLPDGALCVCDSMNFRVQILDPDGRLISQFGKLGDGSGDLNKPKGVAVDSDGNIYVLEGLHDVVQIFDRTGRLLLFFGGSGTGDGELWLPTGIAIHEDMIYVADSSNRRVQVYEYLKERQ